MGFENLEDYMRFSGRPRTENLPGVGRFSSGKSVGYEKKTFATLGANQIVICNFHYASSTKLKGHLGYVLRDGKGLDGSSPELFSGSGEVPDLVKMCDQERFFKIMVSPENGNNLDMKQYVRDYMEGLEESLGKKMNWAAAVHYNTDHPHAHIIIGSFQDGSELKFEKTFIKETNKNIAIDIANQHLGFRTQIEIQQAKINEIIATRYTSIDKHILKSLTQQTFEGYYERGVSAELKYKPNDYETKLMNSYENKEDGLTMVQAVRDVNFGKNDLIYRPGVEIKERNRLEFLEKIGLVSSQENGTYLVKPGLKQELEFLQESRDITKMISNKQEVTGSVSKTRRDTLIKEGVVVFKDVKESSGDRVYIVIKDKYKNLHYYEGKDAKEFKEGEFVRLSMNKLSKIDENRISGDFKMSLSGYKGMSEDLLRAKGSKYMRDLDNKTFEKINYKNKDEFIASNRVNDLGQRPSARFSEISLDTMGKDVIAEDAAMKEIQEIRRKNKEEYDRLISDKDPGKGSKENRKGRGGR